MIRRALFTAMLIMALAAPAGAFTCTPTGCSFDATYTEPTKNTSGGAVNLTGTTVYYKLDSGPEKVVQVSPSSAAGGVQIVRPIVEPILPGQKVVITGSVTAKNAFGESVRSPLQALTIDRSSEVPPNPPVGDSFR